MSCEICRSRAGDEFGVNYGRKATSTPGSGDGREPRHLNMAGRDYVEITTRYVMGGRTTVELCERCRRREQRKWMLGMSMTWVLSLVGLVLLGTYDGPAVLSILAILLLIVVPFLVLAMLIDGRQRFNERWALRLRQKDLREAGWDTVWTDKELAGLLERNEKRL